MAKTKVAHTKINTSIDPMNIVVFLVMTIFAAVVGYYVGRSSGVSPAYLRETGMMMKENAAMMQSVGKMMVEQSDALKMPELKEKGTLMQDSGSRMMGQADMYVAPF